MIAAAKRRRHQKGECAESLIHPKSITDQRGICGGNEAYDDERDIDTWTYM